MRARARNPSAPVVRARSAASEDRIAVLALAATFFSCLMLQRFGVPITETAKLNLVTVIVAGIVAVTVIAGRARFAGPRLAIYCCLVGWVLVSYTYTAQINRQGGIRASLPSLLHFLILYLPFTVTLVGPLSRERVYGMFQRFLAVVAAAGILQFLAQFAGISVFSFLPWMPEELSVEPIFNVVIPVGSTGLNKSNGFFLVEPSILSQMMAMGIMIEMMFFKRFLFLGMFGTALVLSVSGTGIMVLAFFGLLVVTRGDILSTRMLGLGFALAAVIALVGFVALEDLGRNIVNRAGEIGEEKSSGYLRFVTPFMALSEIFSRFEMVSVFGLGPGSSEKLDLGFHYAIHTPWKVLIEYGVPGMMAWLALVVVACWRPREVPVVLPALFMFMFTGGYQQFGPMVFLLFGLFSFPPDRSDLPPGGASREKAVDRHEIVPVKQSWGRRT